MSLGSLYEGVSVFIKVLRHSQAVLRVQQCLVCYDCARPDPVSVVDPDMHLHRSEYIAISLDLHIYRVDR